MKLRLIREVLASDYTAGRLYVNNVFQCYTLEDADRRLENGGTKIYGETAIPLGSYPVIVNYSNRFKRELPLLVNVPQFEGIRIHPGNTHEDTHGCILVGNVRGSGQVNDSRAAFNKLFEKLEEAYAKEDAIEITVERA